MRDKFEVNIAKEKYSPNTARISITTNGYQYSSTTELQNDELSAVCDAIQKYLEDAEKESNV